jgi:hypothetical protein
MKSMFFHSIDNGADMFRSTKTRVHLALTSLRRTASAVALCLLPFISTTAFAADVPSAAVAYRPGDTVRVFVTFKEPISLKYATVRFSLQGQLPEGQKAFSNFFDVTSPVKSSEREFELTGKIGDHVASGTYQIIFMSAANEGDLSRTFNVGQDFPAITLSIRNDRKVEFPDVKSIKLGEPHRETP